MRKAVVLLCVLALAAIHPASADPSHPRPVRTAGVLASSNVEMLLNIPDAGSVGGRFAGNYYITTTVTGLRIYDATDPEVPMLSGALTLPHWENEDVDVSVSRKLVLISEDHLTSRPTPVRGALNVISWLNPKMPKLLTRFEYPATMVKGAEIGGPGHVASCINDCARYAYVNGARDGSLHVIDLVDPAKPKVAAVLPATLTKAGLPNALFKGGVVHDVSQDASGTAWIVGSGGTSQMDVRNPLKPKLLRYISPADNKKTNHFIHHNSLRLNRDTLLVTEEDYPAMCGETNGKNQGSFQTWRIDIKKTGSGALKPLDEWETELGTYVDGGAAVTASCSSHWFTFNRHKVVAVGWYDQGVRFLDVANPRNIRQVGYWIRPTEGLGASAALFAPGRPDIAYVADYNRGLDILKIDAGGLHAPTVAAPVRAEWFAPKGAPSAPAFARLHPDFGYACLLPKREVA